MNKEIRNYQESMFMGLNLHQCIFSLLAITVAVGIYFGLGKYVGQEMTGWMCILGAAPFAACGFFQYHGMNAEQFAWAYIKSEFLYPKRLLFQSEDLYHACMEETLTLGEKTIIAYDIRELGEQLMPLGMLVTLDSIFNRVIQNWKKGKTTWIFADEFYLLFRYQYSADFFYRLYKRIRKYQGFVTGLTQNVEELLKSDTARLMLANSEFLILLNQATTDRDELASLLNISENQLSYITNVGAGKGLIRCSGNLVPFENSFPKNTKLYRLMTTKPGEC